MLYNRYTLRQYLLLCINVWQIEPTSHTMTLLVLQVFHIYFVYSNCIFISQHYTRTMFVSLLVFAEFVKACCDIISKHI